MTVQDKVCVVTGGANGIGRALAQRFAQEGARAVVVADIDLANAQQVAEGFGGTAMACDVSREEDIRNLIEQVEYALGPIGLFCSNAGISVEGGANVPDEQWRRIFDINFMAHVWTARHLVPKMIARGGGAFLQTVSAAGLLTQIGSAPYAVTKHAAQSFAEWLSVSYGHLGIQVYSLCPQGVKTNLLADASNHCMEFLVETALEPAQVADAVMQGFAAEQFLILPHPEVAEYFRRKAADYDRWLRGMRKLQASTGVNKVLGV
jgi:NAD(P)-dependent dehydrogenase (short-subunit alcohol dehydrogenase family)